MNPNVTFWLQSVSSILERVLTTRGKIYQKWLNLYSTDVGHQFLLMKRACSKVSFIFKKFIILHQAYLMTRAYLKVSQLHLKK